MKKLSIFLLTGAVFVAIFASCTPKSAVSNKANYLRLNLNEGAVYSVQTKVKQNITTHVAGRSINSQMNMSTTMGLKVAKKTEQGNLLLHINFKHIAVNTSAMGQKVSFDSDSQNGNNSKYSNFFNKIENSNIKLKITPRGKILDIHGLDQLKKTVKNSSSINAKLKGTFKKMLKKKKIKDSFFNVGLYPQKPITVGTQWSNKETIQSKLPMTLNTTYKVKKIKPDSVWLAVKGRISSAKDTMTIRGMSVPVEASGTQTGTYTINRSTGLVASGHIKQDMNMTMSIRGRSIKIGMKGTININTDKIK